MDPHGSAGADDPAGPARRASGRNARRGVHFAVSLAIAILIWKAACSLKLHFLVNFSNVPSPDAVLQAAADFIRSPKSLRDIEESSRRVLSGFVLGAAAGIPLGLLIGRIRFLYDSLMPPLEVLRPIPGVAWIPLAILMFATSEQSIIFICFLGAFFPILISTIGGVQNLDQNLVHAARSLGAGHWAIFREVVLPGTLPAIITGLTIGMGTAWFLVITAEMVAGQYGIGYRTWESYTLQKYPEIVVGMLAIGTLGLLSSLLIRFVAHALMPWHRHHIHAR